MKFQFHSFSRTVLGLRLKKRLLSGWAARQQIRNGRPPCSLDVNPSITVLLLDLWQGLRPGSSLGSGRKEEIPCSFLPQIDKETRTSCHRLTFISFIEVNLWTSWFSLITFILFFGTYLISCLVSLAPEVRQPLRSVKEKYNESYKNHS